MANTKRKFYDSIFTREAFFKAVHDLATGEDVDSDTLDKIVGATEYELEGIANRRATQASKPAGERHDPLESEYAVALRNAIVPLIGTQPKTAKELIDLASSKGLMSPKGTPFAAPWVSRVLNATEGVIVVKKVIDKVDSKGLKSQTEATAYKKG